MDWYYQLEKHCQLAHSKAIPRKSKQPRQNWLIRGKNGKSREKEGGWKGLTMILRTGETSFPK